MWITKVLSEQYVPHFRRLINKEIAENPAHRKHQEQIPTLDQIESPNDGLMTSDQNY
jgi:hypothetical protein